MLLSSDTKDVAIGTSVLMLGLAVVLTFFLPKLNPITNNFNCALCRIKDDSRFE